MDMAVTDLPDPDSPTKANVLLFWISKLILSTALKVPFLTLKSILKFFT